MPYPIDIIALVALAQVVLIDLVLAGDNAVVVGMAAAGVDARIRGKVIFVGIAAAVVLRICFALLTTQLLQIVGLTLIGGLLLTWVCWKMFREIRAEERAEENHQAPPQKSFLQAVTQIVIADISMSLDNVLAVAGAAREHMFALAAGLLLSVALMGTAATLIAKMLNRFAWISWVGLAMIVYVAGHMLYSGFLEVATTPAFAAITSLAGAQ